ncbi:F0F1 ATP synthase subunit delta [Trueperella sp. LYQ143]|uniref:F0F1 ATP synthase subunit delta n=1 Tax=Trueperella sp. LYQ143 TaxID=3391059 RepID=UPI003983ABBB
MRSGSKAALNRACERWEGYLLTRAGDEMALAREVFTVMDVLRNSAVLSNALEDGARSPDDRAALAHDVLSGRVNDEVTELVMGLARDQWSQNGDLRLALEHLGVHAILVGARREGMLGTVEEELYQSSRLLKDQRELRLAFTSVNQPLELRQNLAAQIFASASPYTVELIKRAIAHGEKTIASALRSYLRATAQMADHLVASVTSAIPLTTEQEARLGRILSAKYGKDVHIHVTIDTSVIGGVRVHVDDDVIDGTIASRLKAVREVFTH